MYIASIDLHQKQYVTGNERLTFGGVVPFCGGGSRGVYQIKIIVLLFPSVSIQHHPVVVVDVVPVNFLDDLE
jgi:hypothetical protein